jgi:hypothetical protein
VPLNGQPPLHKANKVSAPIAKNILRILEIF